MEVRTVQFTQHLICPPLLSLLPLLSKLRMPTLYFLFIPWEQYEVGFSRTRLTAGFHLHWVLLVLLRACETLLRRKDGWKEGRKEGGMDERKNG